MRLATFNLLHGRSILDGQVHVDRLHSAVADIDADVLGLQEVDRAQARSGRHDLTALAAEAMGASVYRFVPAVMGTPGEQWRPAEPGDADRVDAAAYGIALVSRYPVRRWLTTRLPAAPVRSPVVVPAPAPVWPTPPEAPTGTLAVPPTMSRRAKVLWLRDEPRVLLAAVVETPTGIATIATTHLSFVPGWNGLQLRRAARALRELPAPRYLLGDLNLPGSVPRWLTGWRQLAELPTFPVDDPRVQLDHILAQGMIPAVTGARAVAAPLSDHRVLIADLSDD